MVRCQNPARAGPFGGCVPVQMAGAAPAAAAAGTAGTAAAGNTTAAADAADAAKRDTDLSSDEVAELLADGEDMNDII